MKEELKKLLESQELLKAMKKSYEDAEKKFNDDMQEFLRDNLGFKKNDSFTLAELIGRVVDKQ